MRELPNFLRIKRTHNTAVIVVAVVIVATSSFLAIQSYQLQQYVAVLQDQIEQSTRLRRERDKLVIKISPDVKRQWDALEKERTFDWNHVFSAIEKTANSNIELLEFSPDKSASALILRGESKSQISLLAMISKLESQSALKDVHLIRQQNKSRDTLRTVSFEIRVTIR